MQVHLLTYQQVCLASNVYNPSTTRISHELTRLQEKLQEAAASEICDTDIADVGFVCR